MKDEDWEDTFKDWDNPDFREMFRDMAVICGVLFALVVILYVIL